MATFVQVKLTKYPEDADETALIDLEQVVAVGPPTAMYDMPQPMPPRALPAGPDHAADVDGFDMDDYYVTNIYLTSGHVLQLQGKGARDRLVDSIADMPSVRSMKAIPNPAAPREQGAEGRARRRQASKPPAGFGGHA